MITVMFPSGVRVSYNDANDVSFQTNRIEICYKNEKGDRFYRAAIPVQSSCLIEWREPCTVTAAPVATVKSALELVLHELDRNMPSAGYEETRMLTDLKSKLRRFDARNKVWK